MLVLWARAVWNMPFYFVSIFIETQTQYTKRYTTVFIILNKFSNDFSGRVSEWASAYTNTKAHIYTRSIHIDICVWTTGFEWQDTYDHRFDDVSIVCLLQIHYIGSRSSILLYKHLQWYTRRFRSKEREREGDREQLIQWLYSTSGYLSDTRHTIRVWVCFNLS